MSGEIVRLLDRRKAVAGLGAAAPSPALAPGERIAWRCRGCGSFHFELLLGGTIDCVECRAPQTLRHFDPKA